MMGITNNCAYYTTKTEVSSEKFLPRTVLGELSNLDLIDFTDFMDFIYSSHRLST